MCHREAHKPDNFNEFKRIEALPEEDYPVKMRFVFDLHKGVDRDLCPNVFVQDGEDREAWKRAPPPERGYVNNARQELATYATTPYRVGRDYTCIAMTRALGDFYTEQFGMICEPTTSFNVVSAEEIQAGAKVCLASDGIWDCWAFNDFAATLNKIWDISLAVEVCGYQLLIKSYALGMKYFTKQGIDDMTLVLWSL